MDWKLFVSVFALIFVAELPGKTTFASMLLAARARPFPVFLGACGGFVIHSAIAVIAGRLIGILPANIISTVVGFTFLLMAIWMWREKQKTIAPKFNAPVDFRRTAGSAFTVIFFAQWGDPTQLATAALAAKYPQPWIIFLSATLALWMVSGLAAIIGHYALRDIHPRILQKTSAAVFAVIGLVLLARIF